MARTVTAAVALLCLTGVAGEAADVLPAQSPRSAPRLVAIDPVPLPPPRFVVPDCHEAWSAILITCEPREIVDQPTDLELVQIERSPLRPAALPYKQLFTWP